MGAWGSGILADDTALDVYGDYIRAYDLGKSHEDILAEMRQRYAGTLEDLDEAATAWFAIAKAQWDCGALDARVLQEAESLVTQDLERWDDPRERRKREKAVTAFFERLHTVNVRPRKPKGPPRIVKPAYEAGDCLAIQCEDGTWGAVLVLRHEDGDTEYGVNVLAVLAYRGDAPPPLAFFEERRWAEVKIGLWDRPALFLCYRRSHSKWKATVVKVGKIPLRESEPALPLTATLDWNRILEFITSDGERFARTAGDPVSTARQNSPASPNE